MTYHIRFYSNQLIANVNSIGETNGIENFPYARAALVITNSKYSRKFDGSKKKTPILNLRFHLIERLIRKFCYLFVVLNLLLLFISISLTLTLSFALSLFLSVCLPSDLNSYAVRWFVFKKKRNNKAVRAFRGESVSITSTIDLRTRKKVAELCRYVNVVCAYTCIYCVTKTRCVVTLSLIPSTEAVCTKIKAERDESAAQTAHAFDTSN